ncbi:MAG: serine acetyltransferase [Firmicutes bacterium]|nr:serine acetyltransferase [Bacillota bacterium]
MEVCTLDDNKSLSETGCVNAEEIMAGYRKKLPKTTEKIINSCREQKCNSHVDYEPIPSKESVVLIIDKLFEIIFPGFFNTEKLDPANLDYYVGRSVNELYGVLAEQIVNSIRHDCYRFNLTCLECIDKGFDIALNVLDKIPEVRDILATDVEAAFDGDPAAKSLDEIIFSYPGIYAITIYRVAHLLYKHEVPLLPRIMTEHAHSKTGIDIHPGAEIGERFVIDHGTGVVIGETTVIGNNVRLYQGVTLGALSLPKDAGKKMRGHKRHPNIEDDVIIYSGATILGGETVIGARSIIGGNVWLTESVPPDMQVLMERPELIYKNGIEEDF